MKNNKGFSLVELIIVIAIMAVLVGVIAPQLIKYIEKSRTSADVQFCDTVHTALLIAMSDISVINDPANEDAIKWFTSVSAAASPHRQVSYTENTSLSFSKVFISLKLSSSSMYSLLTVTSIANLIESFKPSSEPTTEILATLERVNLYPPKLSLYFIVLPSNT